MLGVADRSGRLWRQVVAKRKAKSDAYEKAPFKVPSVHFWCTSQADAAPSARATHLRRAHSGDQPRPTCSDQLLNTRRCSQSALTLTIDIDTLADAAAMVRRATAVSPSLGSLGLRLLLGGADRFGRHELSWGVDTRRDRHIMALVARS